MKPTRDEIVEVIRDVIRSITQDWALDTGLEPGTRLVCDLGFASMEFIELMATLDVRFQRKLPYEDLMVENGTAYRQELTIADLAVFIHSNFDIMRQAAGAV